MLVVMIRQVEASASAVCSQIPGLMAAIGANGRFSTHIQQSKTH
jgi:hypothetical protein